MLPLAILRDIHQGGIAMKTRPASILSIWIFCLMLSSCRQEQTFKVVDWPQQENQAAQLVGNSSFPAPVPVGPADVDEPSRTGSRLCFSTFKQEHNLHYRLPLPEMGNASAPLPSDPDGSYTDHDVDLIDLMDSVLRKVVTVNGQVNYDLLRSNLKPQLAAIIQQLTIAPIPLEEGANQAFWINTYNFMMLDTLRQTPELENIAANGRWDLFSIPYMIRGKYLTLDDIQFGILKLGGRVKKNLHQREDLMPYAISAVNPKLYFALTCGASSCPNLRPFAYRGAILPAVLEENMLLFVNDAKHIHIEHNQVKVSMFFNWFAQDLALLGPLPHLIATYMLKNCRPDQRTIVHMLGNSPKLKPENFIPFNWAINKTPAKIGLL